MSRWVKPDFDSARYRLLAHRWASRRAISPDVALTQLGLRYDFEREIPRTLLSEATDRVSTARSRLGGPGAMDLLFQLALNCSEGRIVETGVAFGWSSLALLEGLRQSKSSGFLVSVDMPYVKLDSENLVGKAVPKKTYGNWTLIRKPDRPGICEALDFCNGTIDLCHYDSDKSWWGRAYAYPKLWHSLKVGGIFVSDDIQDNLFFAVFMKRVNARYCIVQVTGKFVGLAVKGSREILRNP